MPNLMPRLNALGPLDATRVPEAVDLILSAAVEQGASDVHLEPTPTALEVRVRSDGVLRMEAELPRSLAPNVIARLKVLAELLTYRVDVPQEGAIRTEKTSAGCELRVSTFPTVHGEKAVVRAFTRQEELRELEALGLPEEIPPVLSRLLRERTGAIHLTGPSGSGKTTTIYACLKKLVDEGGRHIVTLEDPVERLVPGVTQSQVRPGTEFDFARGLRSLLRQDPDVLMVGEIRDPETASTASEAALTGHLVFSTLHAGSACGVLSRLLEMGVEPHLLTGGIRAILNQRLLRKVCGSCQGVGCPDCAGAGMKGRFPIAELLIPDTALRRAVLEKGDMERLQAIALESGMTPIRVMAERAVDAGLTTAAEVDRVLGPAERSRR